MIFLIVSFLSSIVGAICGIGGGVIIKPVLDMFQLADVAAVSFLSGCTVLAMSFYSVGRSVASKSNALDLKVTIPLSVGAAIGGVAGKETFNRVTSVFAEKNTVGMIQSIVLGILVVLTLAYTLNKDRIPTMHVRNAAACLVIGLILGVLSSFLGIGGGPNNLVVLFFFFSMGTKTAAENSLCIILFSQITSLFSTLITGTVPDFQWWALLLMVAGGIGGGMVGRKLNSRMDSKQVDKLFIGLLVVIIGICVYNTWRYGGF